MHGHWGLTWRDPSDWPASNVTPAPEFLLLAAPRAVLELQRARRNRQASDSDADQLARLTRVPGLIWVGFFLLVDVGALLLDVTPDVRDTPPDDWCPAPEPSSLELAADAVREAMRRPRTVLDVAARARADVREVVSGVERTVETLVSVTSGRPVHPLNAVTGAQRRYGTARTTLADHRAVRTACGGTVNDVVLAVVTGGLRRWLMTRRGLAG